MKIVFMGTPDFAKESLKEIYEANYEILGVVTNPDRPSGRGMKMALSPVKQYALEKNLQIYQPEKIKKNVEFVEQIKKLNPDIICVVAYGKILPKEIIELPKKGCINVHGSLLPKYRGAAPIQWAVINGDKKTGITTMYMDEGMDTGDMILKEELEIGENETTGEIWTKLSKIGAKLLVKTLQNIEQGIVSRKKQGTDFSIAPMLQKEDAKIDWKNMTATKIKNLVRGLDPIMGAYTYLDDKKIKIWKVTLINDRNEIMNISKQVGMNENIEFGTIILSGAKEGLYVKAKEGIIKILEIQGQNSRRMKTEEYLRGNKIEIGKIFK